MRQVVLDTETTGLDPQLGHRIIEIAAVEMIDRTLTKNHFHRYVNPQRAVDEGAFRVHGISTEFLQDKPLFAEIVNDFLQFIQGAELIIHNAPFDVGFLNNEFKLLSVASRIEDLCLVCDTLVLAKTKHPGQRNNLDALCKRYDIDNSKRTLHGALLDAEILAAVYLAMTGGQANLFDEKIELIAHTGATGNLVTQHLKSASPVIYATQEELVLHEEFVNFLRKKSAVNLWE